MKVTVIKDSVIYNGVIYKEEQSFEACDAIAESLIERGYVKEITEAPIMTGNLDRNQLEEMSYPELKRLASQMGLSANGKKDELIARICAVEVDVEVEGDNTDDDENAAPDENVGDTEGDNSNGDLPNTSMPE